MGRKVNPVDKGKGKPGAGVNVTIEETLPACPIPIANPTFTARGTLAPNTDAARNMMWGLIVDANGDTPVGSILLLGQGKFTNPNLPNRQWQATFSTPRVKGPMTIIVGLVIPGQGASQAAYSCAVC